MGYKLRPPEYSYFSFIPYSNGEFHQFHGVFPLYSLQFVPWRVLGERNLGIHPQLALYVDPGQKPGV